MHVETKKNLKHSPLQLIALYENGMNSVVFFFLERENAKENKKKDLLPTKEKPRVSANSKCPKLEGGDLTLVKT